jgi:hypothetical protein
MPDNIVNTFLIGTGSGVVSLFIVIVISFICRLRSGERFKGVQTSFCKFIPSHSVEWSRA